MGSAMMAWSMEAICSGGMIAVAFDDFGCRWGENDGGGPAVVFIAVGEVGAGIGIDADGDVFGRSAMTAGSA